MAYTVECITDLKAAQSAWELLSPKEYLMDEWLYRYLYYQYDPKPLYFYLLLKNGTPVALLPLQQNDGKLEFFGGNKFYRNTLFMHDTNPESYKRLFAGIKEPMNLGNMNEPLPGFAFFEEETGYYVLDLKGITSWETYLEKDWQGKSKKNLRSQMRKLQNLGIEVFEDAPQDLETLAAFNIEQFKDKSHFNKPHRINYLNDLIKYFDAEILTLTLDKKIVAVGFSILYKDRYYGLTSGYDTSINNLGKYLIMCRIEQAVRCGAVKYEAGRHDYGWKERFHFKKKPLFRLQ